MFEIRFGVLGFFAKSQKVKDHWVFKKIRSIQPAPAAVLFENSGFVGAQSGTLKKEAVHGSSEFLHIPIIEQGQGFVEGALQVGVAAEKFDKVGIGKAIDKLVDVVWNNAGRLCSFRLQDFMMPLSPIQFKYLIFNRLKLCSQKLHNLGISRIKRFEQVQVAFPHTFQPKILSAFRDFSIEIFAILRPVLPFCSYSNRYIPISQFRNVSEVLICRTACPANH